MYSNKQSGLTMVELMIVVFIAGILAAVAAPSFSDLINSTRQTSTMSLITGDLNRARGEAIKRNRRVLMCVRATDTTCGTGTNWANGWLICHDDGELGACDTAGTSTDPQNPTVIAVRPPVSSSSTITASGPVVQFNPNGTQGTGTTFQIAIGGTWAGATTSTVYIASPGNITKSP